MARIHLSFSRVLAIGYVVLHSDYSTSLEIVDQWSRSVLYVRNKSGAGHIGVKVMFVLFWIFAGLCHNVLGQATAGFCYNATSSSLLACNVTIPKSAAVILDAPDAGKFLDFMPAFAPTSAPGALCRAHSEAFLTALNNLEYWALQSEYTFLFY
ncbi:hypothetical protein B566_EDAN007019 [Ephemera danica]|nr:hypothetical protein B566_EDAN007019 [Ephemera danica]